jgi:ketosteroid isomerase-like protein
MRAASLLALCGLLAGCASAPPPASQLELRRNEVERTERAFARTMADRDFAAFAGFLADDSVFFNGDAALVGPAAISKAWKPLYDGAQAPFSWEPTTVVVLRSGRLALSTGPVRGPDGKIVGQFNSVWRRERSGDWKVVIDKGCNACPCAPR